MGVMESNNNTLLSKGFIVSNPEHATIDANVQLLRVILTPKETKIDFGYQATSYYIKGGWIKISPHTFIRQTGTTEKLVLTNATNIPFGPEKLHFNSSIEWRYFSLYFPPLPPGVHSIDLIESERSSTNVFNFFNIRLDDISRVCNIH